MSGIGGFCSVHQNNSTLAWRDVGSQMGLALGSDNGEYKGLWQNDHCLLVRRGVEDGQPLTQRWNGVEYALVWEGQLFDLPQLCRQVRESGMPLEGEQAGRALLWALIAWGEGALCRLDGEFALAFWDGGGRRLLCARDKLGRKPLCYAWRKDTFVFASRPSALFAYPELTPALDREGICHLLGLGPVRGPGVGLFRGVEEIPGGCCLTVDDQGCRRHRYWRLESRLHRQDYRETAAQVGELIRRSVAARLTGEEQVLLSGGVASSLLTGLAACAYTDSGRPPLQAVTFHCPAQSGDGSQSPAITYGQTVAQAFHVRHREVEWDLTALPARMEQVQLVRDVPGLGCGDAALLYACQELGRGKTVLSGGGAQVIFENLPWSEGWDGGMPTFPRCPALEKRRSVFRTEVWHALEVESYVQEQLQNTLDGCPVLEGEPEWERRRRQAAWLALTWWLPAVMEQAEAMKQAVGVDVKLPLCDSALVEYTWNIPHSMKMLNGHPQQLLWDAAEGLLPPPGRPPRRKKPGNCDGLYRQLVRSRLAALLDDPTAPIHDLVDGPALQSSWLAGGWELEQLEMMAYLLQLNTWMARFGLRA